MRHVEIQWLKTGLVQTYNNEISREALKLLSFFETFTKKEMFFKTSFFAINFDIFKDSQTRTTGARILTNSENRFKVIYVF